MYKLVANDNDIDQKRINDYIGHITKFSDDKDVKNIAVMGPYGSGKSTILEQLKNKDPNKYININMIEFSDDINNSNRIEEDQGKNCMKEEIVQKVEQSIVQQLVYQEDAKILPFSKLKREYPTIKIVNNIILFIILCCGIACFKFFNLLQHIVNFKIAFTSFAILVGFLFLVGISGHLGYKIIFYFYKNFRLVKINFSKNDSSIECERYDSVYNKYIDELIYFFKRSNYDTVIFEDIDRYNDLLFFSHLRELNSLLNKSKDLSKKITFIYAIRDDLFSEKNKTKFFDYIVPVVPIMDYSNSAAKFKQHLRDQNLDKDMINLLSSFVSDYRTLKNICNEFEVYKNIKNSEIYSDNNLLAVLVLKNLYPKEFSQLQFNSSILNYLFNEAKNKIQVKINDLQCEMDMYIKALKDNYNFADPNYLVMGLIKDIIQTNKKNITNYATITGIEDKVYPIENIFNNKVKWKEIENIESICIRYSNGTYDLIELNQYQKMQFSHYKYLQDNKNYLFNKTSEELIENINSLERQINYLMCTKASKYYNDYNESLNELIDQYYLDNKELKRDEKFVVFIKSLILNDLIAENYNRYISLTHGQAKDEKDNLFIHNVYAKVDSEFNMELNDLDYIFEQLKNDIFENRFSFNIKTIMFLAKNNIKGLNTLLKLNSDRLNVIYENIKLNETNSKEVIKETLKNSKDIDSLLADDDKGKRDFWFKELILLNSKDFKQLSISNNIKNEIKNYDLIKLSQVKEKDIKEFIRNCIYSGIKFNNIIGSNKNEPLYNLIIENDLYEMNYKNIQLVTNNFDFNKVVSNEQIENYIIENLDAYIKLILENDIKTKQPEEFNQIVIKKCKDRNQICEYFIKNKVYINNIDLINNEEELMALCANKENTINLLKKKSLSKEIKSNIICELKNFNENFINEFALDLCDIIKSEKLYTEKLLSNYIYLELLKSENIIDSDRCIILDNIIEICDKQNLLRIIKAYDSQFRNLKKPIVLKKNSINTKLTNRLVLMRLFDKIEEKDDCIFLKKIEWSDIPPLN